MYDKLSTHWYALPVLSGALLIASFHPFNLWPLAFVALAPLYYFVAGFPHQRLSRVFWGGFLTGSIFAFSLSYFTLIQFHWLPEAYLFTAAVKLSVVPITLLSGCVVGVLSALVFRLLRSHSIILNALLGAAVYTASEMLLQGLFGGYYLAHLAYAAAAVPPLLSLASIGGASAVSFVIAFINALAVGALIEWRVRRGDYLRALLWSLVVLCALMAFAVWRQESTQREAGALTVALIQTGMREGATFGAQKDGVFRFEALEGRLREAAQHGPDLIVYPFSPVEGALYRDEQPQAFNKPVLAAKEKAFAQWLRPLSGSSTVMTWNTLYAEGEFRNEYQFWRGGEMVAEYRKRRLFPFMDYTPQWAQRWGLYSTPYDVAAGGAAEQVALGGIRFGSLMCSELHDAALASLDAERANVLLAVGSEAMFIDAVASNFALRAAQFRAVETALPVIRGNLLGPSALINPDGRIVKELRAGEEGILRGEVVAYEPRSTPYGRFGDLPLRAIICVILVGAWLSRSRSPDAHSR